MQDGKPGPADAGCGGNGSCKHTVSAGFVHITASLNACSFKCHAFKLVRAFYAHKQALSLTFLAEICISLQAMW